MVAPPQHRIARTLNSPEGLATLRTVIGGNPNISRHKLAQIVCERFGFKNPRGVWQSSSCTTALNRMVGRGLLDLAPSARKHGWHRHPRGTGVEPESPVAVPEQAGDIRDLRLELVQNDDELRLWNELMLREHPQGDQIITGRQLRYFVRSEHGLLGGLGASAAALHLEARDHWIGWDWDLRSQYLERIVCLSRFLIRTNFRCHNLASRVLGLFCRQVGNDMERAYGCRPWLLESFVETHHTGSSYTAANWQRIGRTKGRGRNDSANAAPVAPKDLYVYPLQANFRQHLGLPHDAGAVAIPPGDGVVTDNWAEKEFGGAQLGDNRLSTRLVAIAALKAANPREPFSECANGRNADMQGYYRFIEHEDDDGDALTMDAILRPHRERTIKRIRGQPRVLCPQDSTDLDYSNLEDCEGLGHIGSNQSGILTAGLRLHTALAITPDGLPLGILDGECHVREFRPGGPKKKRLTLPVEQRESYRWITTLQECEAVAEQVPGTTLVCVMDREGDIFELFHHWQKTKRVELLVRACKNRCTDSPDGEKLFDQVRRAPECSRHTIIIPDRRSKQLHSVRSEAELSVRYCPITIQIPQQCKITDAKPIELWMTHAIEIDPPAGVEQIEWFLISSEPVETTEKALQNLKEYSRRWRIEDWHKILKSGCAVEEVRSDTAAGLQRIIAINMVIAWRIQIMTLLSRSQPDLPPQVMFSDLELKVLTATAKADKRLAPVNLQLAVMIVGTLGGYRARKTDRPPGAIVLWRGYTKLRAMCQGAALMLGFNTG